jgi:hypothetical protein
MHAIVAYREESIAKNVPQTVFMVSPYRSALNTGVIYANANFSTAYMKRSFSIETHRRWVFQRAEVSQISPISMIHFFFPAFLTLISIRFLSTLP